VSSIRIVLADDHAILRAGLRLLVELAGDMEVVGEAKDAEEVRETVARVTPDVLVLDISMPGGGTLEALEEIHDNLPDVRVLVLTMHDDESYLRAALAAGAAGYLVKSAADEELINAIRAVAAGRSYVGVSLSRRGLKGILDGSGSPKRLSAREKEVLELAALGLTNHDIAERLGVGIKSIESYRARLYEKLGFHGRRDLVRYAVGIGLLSPERLAELDVADS
jgi:DNA-binding NarL/FixJ family response regulator